MSLLRADTERQFDAMLKIRTDRLDEVLRAALWGADGTEVPVGHVDLREEGPAKQGFLKDMLVRAEREETGRAAGDLASTAVGTPSMQRALEEEARDGTS